MAQPPILLTTTPLARHQAADPTSDTIRSGQPFKPWPKDERSVNLPEPMASVVVRTPSMELVDIPASVVEASHVLRSVLSFEAAEPVDVPMSSNAIRTYVHAHDPEPTALDLVQEADVARVADFLEDETCLATHLHNIASRLTRDAEIKLGDKALQPLPPSCLETVARSLDRDSAIEFLGTWDVGPNTALRDFPIGGLRICRSCAHAATRRAERSIMRARDTLAREQIDRGAVFDASGLVSPVAIIPELHQELGDDIEIEIDSDDDGSEYSVEYWVDLMGMAQADPEMFVALNGDLLVQHERWGNELRSVWHRQRGIMDRGRETPPPPLARVALVVSVGQVLSGDTAILRSGHACVACAISEAQKDPFADFDHAMEKLAASFASTRTLLDLRADDPDYVPARRRRASTSKDPESSWRAECADLQALCARLGVCVGCGLTECDGSLNCASSRGLTRRIQMCSAPSIRRFVAEATFEQTERLTRSPPSQRKDRRSGKGRRRRARDRDRRPKCETCFNLLPTSPHHTCACKRCKQCCREAGCVTHFPAIHTLIRDAFSRAHPPPLINFQP